METLQEQRDKVEKAQREVREAQSWLKFLMQHPEISNVESNRLIALEYHNGSEMTLNSLLDSFNSPTFREMLAFVNPQKQRTENLATIHRITGVGETELTKWQTDDQLAKRAKELEERRELSKRSPAELRAIIKENTPAVAEDDLPAHMTRAFLLGLNQPGAFKKVCERYGVAAVTKRLNQR